MDREQIGREQNEQSWYVQTRNIIYFILGVIEALLAFRLVFKLLGANTASSFVVFLYGLTRVLVAPFVGIFNTFATPADGTQFIFEPAVLVAMLVYAVIARGLVHLVKIRTPGHA